MTRRGCRVSPASLTDDVDTLRGRVVRADDDGVTFEVRAKDRERIRMARAREGVKVGVSSHSQ